MQKLISFWDRQKWTDKLAEKIRPQVDKALEMTGNKQKAADILNGVWLGHPLHPMLVSLPIGAWTAATTFDTVAMLSGGKSRASTGLVALGIATSLPTAMAGVADWKHLSGSKARLGSGHALMNLAALGCFKVSLLSRLAGGNGRIPALMGMGFVAASGYVGAHLVYSDHVGVKHAPDAEAPASFEHATHASEIGDNSLHRVEVDGLPVLLARVEGRMHAVSDVCTHLGCSLAEGRIEGDEVVCPCHSSRFSLVDGRVTAGPATLPLQTYDLRVVDGEVEIREGTPSYSQ